MLYVSSVKCLKFVQNGHFPIFQPILAAIFVTIATVKVEPIPEVYTWDIALINYKEGTNVTARSAHHINKNAKG